MLLSLSILLVATLVAALSVLVQYTRDTKRRKHIQRKVEGIVSPLFLMFVIYLIGWQRENIAPAVLVIAAVILFLIPLMLYPFSPAAKEEPRHTRRRFQPDPHNQQAHARQQQPDPDPAQPIPW